MGTWCALFARLESTMNLEELRKLEAAALVACDESDNEPPFVRRYLAARAAREEAEEAQTSRAGST